MKCTEVFNLLYQNQWIKMNIVNLTKAKMNIVNLRKASGIWGHKSMLLVSSTAYETHQYDTFKKWKASYKLFTYSSFSCTVLLESSVRNKEITVCLLRSIQVSVSSWTLTFLLLVRKRLRADAFCLYAYKRTHPTVTWWLIAAHYFRQSLSSL